MQVINSTTHRKALLDDRRNTNMQSVETDLEQK